MENLRRVAFLMTMLGFLGSTALVRAQSLTLAGDADQIAGLMKDLSGHSKSPSDVLDPSLSPVDREKNLRRFGMPQYELSLMPTSGIPEVTGDAASVPVRVHFDGKDGNTLDTSSTAQFVKRNGVWYFSNFDFLSWPAFLVVVLIGGLLVGVGYATTVIVLMLKLFKHGPLGMKGIQMFFPIFWPRLFREAR